MSQTECENLSALEQLLEEFFAHSTPNRRKLEIEEQLGSFGNQRDSWKTCLYFLTHSSSHYVLIYTLSTLESVINRRWVALEWEQRVQLKTTLYEYYIKQDGSAPHFLRNKLAKLVVDVARFDWPHFYPEFFENILQLLQTHEGQLLGLILLRTASEELTNPHRDVTSQRRDELAKLLQHNIPRALELLCRIFEGLSFKMRRTTTATPPPSPTHPGTSPDLSHHLAAATRFRLNVDEVTREALRAVQHLFTWVPLQTIPEALVAHLFRFNGTSSSYGRDENDKNQVRCIALSALNEILYRRCVPNGTEVLFLHFFRETMQLLKDVSNSPQLLQDEFIGKLCELLALLVDQHLWRLDANVSDFSALELLSLLFQLTLNVPSVQSYTYLLSVWSAFIKQLMAQKISENYSKVLVHLVQIVLNKLQFCQNCAQLEGVKELIVEENETQWEVFLKNCAEIVALAGECIPLETFNQTLVLWTLTNDFYCAELQKETYRNRCINSETVTALRHNLIDMSSLTQILARLSALFTDNCAEHYKMSLPLINKLLNALLESAYLVTTSSLYGLHEYFPYFPEYVDVHGQIMAALKTWSPWLPLSDCISADHLNHLLAVTLPLLKVQTVGLYEEDDPKFEKIGKVYCAVAHLLLSVTSAVSPPRLMMQSCVVAFVHVAPALAHPVRVQEIINGAVCNILLRSWGELSETDLAQRDTLVETFANTLTLEFRRLTPCSSEEEIRIVSKRTLRHVANVIDFSKNFSSHSKKLLYTNLKPAINIALDMFSNYSKHPEISDCVLVLFLNVLNCLQQQFGVDNTKRTIQVFLDIAVQNQLSMNLCGLDKLLQILQIVVESPSASYKSLLPDILRLCLEQVHPFVIRQVNEEPDIFVALLLLLKSILVHRWTYFYVSQIRLGHSPGCSELNILPDNFRRPVELLAVLQIFGQALLQPDINVFRTSLSAIEELNVRWKLYHKTLFRQQVLASFLTVLINALLDRTHALLHEDVMHAIYHMATVEFDAFFDTFLPEFLQNSAGLAPSQRDSLRQLLKRDMDMPTFIQNFQRFVNDLKCYRNCNANLPLEGVVSQL